MLFVVIGAKQEYENILLNIGVHLLPRKLLPFQKKSKTPETIILKVIYFFVNLHSKVAFVLLSFLL